MSILWHFLTFAVGCCFGVVLTALMVASGDDRK